MKAMMQACLLVASTLAVAQTPAPAALRDPTKPPAAYSAVLNPPVQQAASLFQPRQVVVVNGEHLLVWNGRRYKVGDSIDGARIEKIGEAEIWMHGVEGTRKLSLFDGVEKRPPRTSSPVITLGEEAATSKKGHKK